MTRQQLGKISCIALLHSCPQEEVHKLPALPAAPTRPRCRIAWRQQAGSSEECVTVRQGACTSCTSTWLFKQGGRELHSASLTLQYCVCQLHSILHTFTDLFPVQHTSTHFAKDVQFVLHFVLSLQLVMRHNCLKPASTQLRGRVQINGTRMTSCNVHDTALH